MPVARTELTRLDGVTRLPNGGLRVDAVPTRAGVLVYRDGAGNERREYRPPAEVFAQDSLATLRGATVTDLHPRELVTPANWAALAKGHVGDDVRPDGATVAASIVVQDAAEVGLVERRERVELSCGYTCELDPTPGVTPEGERYDAVQRSIRYNHVALGPADWGRAGPECALRLDGGDAAAVCVRTDAAAATTSVRADAPAAKERSMKVLKICGREFKCDAADDMVAAQGAVDQMQAKKDADAAALEALQKALQDAMGALAAMRAKAEAGATPPPAAGADAEIDPAVLDSKLAEREALVADARKVLGADFDAKGKKPGDIKRAAIAKVLPTTKLDSLSADAVDGMFAALVGTARNDALGDANAAALEAAKGTARADTVDDARAKYQREMEERSRRPLGAAAK